MLQAQNGCQRTLEVHVYRRMILEVRSHTGSINHNVNVTPFASLSNLEKELFDQMVKLDCERQRTEMAWRDSVEFHCNRVGLEYGEDFQYELHEMIERVEGRGEMYQKHEEFAAVAQKADNVEHTLHTLWRARNKPNMGQPRIELNPPCSNMVLEALDVDDIGVAVAILEEAIR